MSKFNFPAEPILTVYKTTAYDAFKILKGNRRINQIHLDRLKRSFEKKHLVTPVIVNNRMQVIDGQHRVTAARTLNLPIYFIVLENYDLDEVQILNSNIRVYNKMDAIGGYCELGNTNYIILNEFMTEYPELGVAGAIQLLTSRADGDMLEIVDEDGHKRNFKEGGFVVKTEVRTAKKWAKQLREIGQYYKGFTRRAFVTSMMGVFQHPNYKHDEFILKIKGHPELLSDTTTAANYRLMVEDAYNYRRREKVSLRY